jgi:hypothetical protein
MPKIHSVKNPRSKGLWQVLFSTVKGVLQAKNFSLGSVILLKSEQLNEAASCGLRDWTSVLRGRN